MKLKELNGAEIKFPGKFQIKRKWRRNGLNLLRMMKYILTINSVSCGICIPTCIYSKNSFNNIDLNWSWSEMTILRIQFLDYATFNVCIFCFSGFVFLRLLCPAIRFPKQFNLITGQLLTFFLT